MNRSLTRVAIFSAFYEPAFLGGGPIRTLAALAAKAPRDHQLFVLTSDRDLGATDRLPVVRNQWIHRGDLNLFYASVDSYRSYVRALRSLRRKRPQVIYLNSLFEPRFSIIPLLLHRIGWLTGTMLLAPRGELGRGALGLKSRKKSLFLRIARGIGLYRHVHWHASSESEAQDIRSVFRDAAPLIRADETALPERSLRANPPQQAAPRLLFVGRIVPVKGLDILLRGLADSQVTLTLDVVGAEEDSTYAALCKHLAACVPRRSAVHFLGPMSNDITRATMPTYDALVLPTLGENFGHVVAEALSCGIPVLCSDNTPWTETIAEGGGRIVSPNDPDSWRSTVEWFAALSIDDRRNLRTRAANAYDGWQDSEESPHIFTLLQSQMESTGG